MSPMKESWVLLAQAWLRSEIVDQRPAEWSPAFVGISSFLLARLWVSKDDGGQAKQFNAMMRSIRNLWR